MRHRKKSKSLGREKDQRKSLFRNLAISLILEDSIKTTLPKAKELRSFIEPLVTKAENDDLSTKRYLMKKIDNEKAVKKLLEEIGPNHSERPGGYTRIIKLGRRDGDGAKTAMLEFVD